MAEDKTIMPYDGNYTPVYGYDLTESVYKTAGLVWDVPSLSWVKMQQPLLTAEGLTVTVDMSATNALIQEIIDENALAMRVDEVSSTLMYVGEAAVGSLASASVWRIKKIDQSSGIVITWADGDSNFNNVWTNRASLTYI